MHNTYHAAYVVQDRYLQDLGITPREMLDIMQADPFWQTSPEIEFLRSLGYRPEIMCVIQNNMDRTHEFILQVNDIGPADMTLFLLHFPQ